MMNRRRFVGSSLFAATVGGLPAPMLAKSREGEFAIGLTAVVVREYVRSFNDFGDYLSRRTGRPVEFVQRRTYADIMDMLKDGNLQAAWICGYPYVQPRDPEYIDLLATPVYRGAPLYRSLVIVPRGSPVRRLSDLKGKVYAYSDPDSNSGFIVPRATLADAGYDPERFFRLTFFTYSHAETVSAVADRLADGGSVDSYVYNILRKYEPKLAASTRVIAASRQYGFPPIVLHRNMTGEIGDRFRDTLLGMAADAEGRTLLERLDLDGFAVVSPALYDSIRDVARRASPPYSLANGGSL
jgi:phosphate/phosphite/phosphonate ABC transporter binding protein